MDRETIITGGFKNELSEWIGTRGYSEVRLDVTADEKVRAILDSIPEDWTDRGKTYTKEEFIRRIKPILQLRLDRATYTSLMSSSARRQQAYYAIRSAAISFQPPTNKEVFKIQETRIRELPNMINKISGEYPNEKIYFHPVKLNSYGYGQEIEELNKFMTPKDPTTNMPNLRYYLEFDPANRGAFTDKFRTLANLYAQGYTILIAPESAQPQEVLGIIQEYQGAIRPSFIYPMSAMPLGDEFNELYHSVPNLRILAARYTDPQQAVALFNNDFYRLVGLDILRFGVGTYRFTRDPIQEYYDLYDDANKAPFWAP